MIEAVKKGDVVSVHYTGTLNDGTIFDSSEGRAPLQFEVGAGEVIPGFEKAIEGMNIDEEKKITLSSKDAYGDVKKEMIIPVPREQFPKDKEPAVGMTMVMAGPQGQRIPARVIKVEENRVTIDLNHPLAGKDLTFTVKVVGINEPIMEKEDGCCGGGCTEGGACCEEESDDHKEKCCKR